jgi:Ser/Thr protein kinase RdoA (MazF antagonist)
MEVPDAATHREWLRRHHGAMRTPRAIVDAQVESATGARVKTLQRILIGEVNEVYAAATTDDDRLIVRISHAEDSRFEAERWALDAARAVGVPTPQVRHIQRITLDDGRTITVSIEEKLPGVPLDVLLDRGVWPKRAIAQLGELLSALHGIAVDGFGYLQPDGRGWPITFASRRRARRGLYHGGDWKFFAVTWNVAPYLLTSAGVMLAAAAAGDVTVTRVAENDFKCPVQP